MTLIVMLCNFNVQGSVHCKYFPIIVQQDATLYSLFISVNALHVSGGNSTHHQEHTQLYLQHLALVKPLLLPGQEFRYSPEKAFYIFNQQIQGGSNMTGTNLYVNKCKQSRSYLNHLVYFII